jgi:predicted deacylase
LVPCSLFPSGSDASNALAVAFGLPIAVVAGGEGYTINAAHKLGVPGIIVEVSGNGLWDEEKVGEMTAGIERVMGHLGMQAGPTEPAERAAPQIVTMWVPQAPSSGLWYPAKELSAPVSAGETLGEIRDVFGGLLSTIQSKEDGFILYRLTSLSVNKGEALLGVAKPVAGWP